MGSNLFDILLPGGIALMAITFFRLRRHRRSSSHDRAYNEWLEETRNRVKSWQENETAAFEEYQERLERQRALIERYNREHGDDQP